jgi:hypothetical protein
VAMHIVSVVLAKPGGKLAISLSYVISLAVGHVNLYMPDLLICLQRLWGG